MKQQQFNLLPIVAFGGLLSVIAAPSEPSECMGKKRKKDTVVEDFYEVDCIKARRVVKLQLSSTLMEADIRISEIYPDIRLVLAAIRIYQIALSHYLLSTR